MNRLIGIAGWVDIVDDESISFYTPVTLSLLVPSIMIDESKTLNLNYSFNWYWYFCLSPILEKGNLGKCFFRNICIMYKKNIFHLAPSCLL